MKKETEFSSFKVRINDFSLNKFKILYLLCSDFELSFMPPIFCSSWKR